jgi:hypothetical protein
MNSDDSDWCAKLKDERGGMILDASLFYSKHRTFRLVLDYKTIKSNNKKPALWTNLVPPWTNNETLTI